MVIGLDTGFFVALMQKEKEAVRFWKDLSLSEIPPVVSILTIGELLYVSFRLNQPDLGKQLAENIFVAANVVPVEREVAEKAAGLKASIGIPYVDSLILATFVISRCKEIHTTDKNHFSRINIKGMRLVFHNLKKHNP